MKQLLLFFLLPCVVLAQAPAKSVMQEQSEFYGNYHLSRDAAWDSLNKTLNSSSPAAKLAQATSTCSLKKRVFGWHPYWNGTVYTNYNWGLLSDFCYFDYAVTPTTGQNSNTSFAWSTSAAVTAAKANGKKIHICATLFASHATFWATPSAQTTFINNIISLLNSRGGNGVNIDFEGMGASDKTPFKNFMVSLKNALIAANPNYELSVALYAVDWSTSFDIPGLTPSVDAFIIMGYDYYYSGSAQAGPEAPLYDFQTSYDYTVTKSITYYLKQGAPPSKLLLGLPYYGREWETVSNTAPSNTTGAFTSTRLFNYVKSNPATYSAANKKWESNCYNPYYTYLSGGNWRQCWIDDSYSMGRKFDMVNQRNIGGIGIWALGYDDGYSDFWQLIQDKFSTCEVRPCTDSLFDMGGPTRNYYDNESYTYSISPNGVNKVQLQFKSFSTEQGYDSLFVYNGPNTAAPLMGAYTGTALPGTLTSSGTAITLRFKSDGATVAAGFKIIYSCVTSTGLDELPGSENEIMIYPNPNSGLFEIRTALKGKLFLYSSTGEKIFESPVTNGSVDLSSYALSEGIYFLQIVSENKSTVKKIIFRK
ncbi:MAG: glycosyl hydrolase family 18 protein [Bacteroidia bacterium]